MASNINVQGICSRKGDIPVGTGLGGADFARTSSLSLDPITQDVLPGYSLQSSATTANGVDWSFTGAGGRTIQTYSFPGCPLPFPTPADVASDLVQITREDTFVGDAGLVDLNMPVLGIQGFVPTHSLPSLCDTDQQLVFFFDNANAAINVYNVALDEWKMGWVRAVITSTFRWNAAALLTADKINTTNQYAAPYNAVGIFFAADSSVFTSASQQSSGSPQTSGLYFLPYTKDGGTGKINDWTAAQFKVPYASATSLAVSAIETVNQKINAFRVAPGAATWGQIVLAVATNTTSALNDVAAGNNFAWWGFLGRVTATTNPIFLNPNYTDATTATVKPFQFWENVAGTDLARGFIQTISYNGADVFFLGGNYSFTRFNGTLLTRTFNAGAFTQSGSVALTFKFNPLAPTIDQYGWVGDNSNTAAARQWTGRVANSNYTSAGYFVFGGTFITPPSQVITTLTAGLDPATTPFAAVSPYIQTSFQNQTLVPSALIEAPARTKTGTLDTLKILFNDDGNAIPSGASKNDQGFCISLTPDSGDYKQATYRQSFIGGNFLNPALYVEAAYDGLGYVAQFQTQLPIVATNWWFAYISFYTDRDYPSVDVAVGLFPYTVNAAAEIPFLYPILGVSLKKGYNSLRVLGGAGNLFNSNIPRAGAAPLSSTPQVWRADIGFSLPVRYGVNAGNGNQFTGCWVLEGYSNDGITTANGGGPGFFTSYALAGAPPKATQTTAAGSRRTLTYTNLGIPIPLTVKNFKIVAIPINTPQNYANMAVTVADDSLAIMQVTTNEDRQGNFQNSCLLRADVPSVLYDIPEMGAASGIQPAFSVFGNSQYEIYKASWANSDQVSLGLYTNFQEISSQRFVKAADDSSLVGSGSAGQWALQISTGVGVIRFNSYNTVTQTMFRYVGKVLVGDLIKITEVSTGNYQINKVTANPTENTAQFWTEFATTIVAQTITLPSIGSVCSVDMILSRNPEQSPFVLRQNFGQYNIGNGSAPSSLRDVYLSSFSGSGKSYRYVPNYENNFVSFDEFLLVGNSTTDDTLLANTALFNSNDSSLLLRKSTDGQNWVVADTFGNVTFNTQTS